VAAVSRSRAPGSLRRQQGRRRTTLTGQGRATRGLTLSLLVLAVAILLAVWQLGYDRTVFVPSPATVWTEIVDLLGTGSTYSEIAASLARLVVGMTIGTVLGLIAGLAGAYSDRTAGVVRTYVQITFAIPSLMAAFLALVVFGISSAGVVATVAVLIFPFVTTPVMDGLKSLDRSLGEMARVYRFSRRQHLRHVVLPHIAPYLLSGMRNAHSIGWRVLIVAEIFSVRSGIGYEFHRASDQFLFSQVLAWLTFMLIVIGLIEFLVLRPLEDWTLRWRRTSAAGSSLLTRAAARIPGRRQQIGAR
jgi:NitT/TauT family transport system permease protein